MEFYKVKDDEIKFSNEFGQEDIVFILDGKAGYIWKGKFAKDLDESTAKNVENLLLEKFKGIKFELITELELKDKDNPKLIQIKKAIKDRLPKPVVAKVKEKQAGFIKKIKTKISEFKAYENSWNWRKKLSNLTNLWKLSILNIVIIAISVFFILNQFILHFFVGELYLIIAIAILSIILIINLVFIVFPMKFPIDPLSLGGETKIEKLPPKPIIPEGTIKSKKLKPVMKQMELAPLKAPKARAAKGKGDAAVDGAEYLSEEDMDLGIPAIPEAPKKKQKITMDSPGLEPDILELAKKMENKNTAVVFVNCRRCKGVIPVPVPKKAVLDSELPVVPISYVHKNSKDKDQHCITIHLDHDFDIRRERYSDCVVSK